MDKKTLTGLLVIGVILLGFTWYSNIENEKVVTAKRIEQARIDSINRVNAAAIAAATPASVVDTLKDIEAARAEKYEEQLQTAMGSTLYSAMTGTEEFYYLENEVMKMTLSNRGGRVATVQLKNYRKYGGTPLMLYNEESSVFNMAFFTNQLIETSKFYFTPVKVSDTEFAMRLYADSVSYMEYLYTVRPNDYMVDFKVNFKGISHLMAPTQPNIQIAWSMVTPQQEKGFENENNYTTIAYKYPNATDIEEIGMSKESKEEKLNTRVEWIDFKQQFFSSIFVSKEEPFQNATMKYETFIPTAKDIKAFSLETTLPYSPTKSEYNFSFYFGPNKYSVLNDYAGFEFQQIVPLGWWIIGWVNRWLVIPIFDYLGNYISSYGIIILILTLIIKLLVSPLTYKSYLSTAKMRLLKPEVEEITKRYPKKEDALKKQQATMEMYRKAGVSPMGGCLPMLIQFPFLIAMFRFFPASIELRDKSFLWADDLSSYDSIFNLPFDIPFYGDHVSLFTLLMALSMYVSTKITYANQAMDSNQMPGMKFMMLYMMPIMLLLWFNNYSSGLSYYYLLANVITIAQTYAFRRFIDDGKLHMQMKDNAKKPKKQSKFQQRYADMVKQQQQMQKRK